MANTNEAQNTLCTRCINKCKQPASAVIITCPKFEAAAVQLEIKLTGVKSKRKPLAV